MQKQTITVYNVHEVFDHLRALIFSSRDKRDELLTGVRSTMVFLISSLLVGRFPDIQEISRQLSAAGECRPFSERVNLEPARKACDAYQRAIDDPTLWQDFYRELGLLEEGLAFKYERLT